MRTYIFKVFTNNRQHFYKIHDKQAKYTLLLVAVLLMLFIYCVLFPVSSSVSYHASLKAGYTLQGIDNLFDYAVPLVLSLIINYAFFSDYKSTIREVNQFYSANMFNYSILYKWLYYNGVATIGSMLCSMLYYRNINVFSLESIWFMMRTVPNLWLLTALFIGVARVMKNAYSAFFICITYYALDYLSGSRLFSYLSLGAHSNNFYYTYSVNYYIVNRVLLIFAVFILLYLSCRSTKKWL